MARAAGESLLLLPPLPGLSMMEGRLEDDALEERKSEPSRDAGDAARCDAGDAALSAAGGPGAAVVTMRGTAAADAEDAAVAARGRGRRPGGDADESAESDESDESARGRTSARTHAANARAGGGGSRAAMAGGGRLDGVAGGALRAGDLATEPLEPLQAHCARATLLCAALCPPASSASRRLGPAACGDAAGRLVAAPRPRTIQTGQGGTARALFSVCAAFGASPAQHRLPLPFPLCSFFLFFFFFFLSFFFFLLFFPCSFPAPAQQSNRFFFCGQSPQCNCPAFFSILSKEKLPFPHTDPT
jgi:hypothetical protein